MVQFLQLHGATGRLSFVLELHSWSVLAVLQSGRNKFAEDLSASAQDEFVQPHHFSPPVARQSWSLKMTFVDGSNVNSGRPH